MIFQRRTKGYGTRSQMVLDRIADGLFRSAAPEGPALTSLIDHLGYLAFHGWERLAGGSRTAYDRLVWLHAWANLPLTQKDRGRWVVYGVLKMRRGERPSASRWARDPGTLVALDPRARYAGLWRAAVQGLGSASAWPYLAPPQERLLQRWASGDIGGFEAIRGSVWRSLMLNRFRGLSPLSRAVISTSVDSLGIGLGLRACTIRDILHPLSAGHETPSDTWTRTTLSQDRSTHPVRERLRRAALGRAIVWAANQSFFQWAERQLPKRRERPLPQQETAFDLLQRVSRILARDANAREALSAVDRHLRLAGGTFSINRLLDAKSPRTLDERTVELAYAANKGFVTSARRLSPEFEPYIYNFSGSYAGSLRLRGGALLGGQEERPDDLHQGFLHACGFHQSGGHDAWMETVDCDPRTFQTTGQRVAEQDRAQHGLRVAGHPDTLLALKVVQVERSAEMRLRRNIHDARGTTRFDAVQQFQRQQNLRQVVDRPSSLEAGNGRLSRRQQDAGVVDEHIQLVVPFLERRRQSTDFRLRREIGDERFDLRISALSAEFVHRLLGEACIAANDHDASAAPRQPERRGLSDSRCCAGDETDFPLHVTSSSARSVGKN
jgi:hypothetical protein